LSVALVDIPARDEVLDRLRELACAAPGRAITYFGLADGAEAVIRLQGVEQTSVALTVPAARPEWAQRAARSAAKLARRQLRAVEPPSDPARLSGIARTWLAARRATHRSAADDRCRWRVHLAPAFGDLEPGQVDASMLRAFIEAKLKEGLSSSTVGRCIRLLSTLFTDLVDQGLVPRNPVSLLPRAVRRLYRNAHDPRTTPFLEDMADVGRIRAELPEPYQTMFSVAVMTGVRPGELSALEWKDFSADLKVMHIQRSVRDGRVTPPKSGRGRVVPIARALVPILVAWRRATEASGLLFRAKEGAVPSQGRFVGTKSRHDAWYAALQRARVAPITFYQATRHTFASHWVMAGHSIEKLSKILGHSSVLVTEHYAHLKPEALSIPDVISLGVAPRPSDTESDAMEVT
jgi:integrase